MKPGLTQEQKHDTWWAYHQANPHVYEAFMEMVRELQAAGITKTGMSLLAGRLRWLKTFQTAKTDPHAKYKIDNDLLPWYARYIMYENPELLNFFEIREPQ